ncbi:glutamyl-tRNA synthetase [Ephemerocybe angulata]|uniref:Glutamate--tRNA ligase, mitochondrial n=1 Tax=Ephemerocybe angulata TaxID=980116 RepID=A0A8H6I6N3_9AGAR|nr:glutamyl-tRNA synthetase [Tulosesus angulatus]
MVLLRFAPSPTGPLHLGGLRMALYNHLFAKKHGGKWILRIEDTDATRYVPGSVEGIRKALDWAGMEYDFGPGKNGPHAPYYQSERLDLYKEYSKKLLDTGHAYRCFCSMDRLADVREKLARTGSNATYDRECLHLTEEEVARRVKAGEKSIVRLNGTQLPARPTGVDLIFGQLKDAHASLATDPILLKSDLFPTYHLASVVDDHEMGITHVLRGEEWLPSLPLHLDLYAALKLAPPQFAHLPILLNADGSKMSKRNGDVQVEDYIRRGWEPVSVLNWLALAGWGAKHNPNDHPHPEGTPCTHTHTDAPDSTAVYTLPELITEFDLSAVTHRNSSLDPMKLEYLNKQHLLRERGTPEGLRGVAERVHGYVKESFPESPYTSTGMIEKAIELLEGRLTNLKELPIHAYYLFEEPDLGSEEAREMRGMFDPVDREKVLSAVHAKLAALPTPWTPETEGELQKVLHGVRKEIKVPTKVFMKTLRHALTGFKDGPSIPDIVRVLGPERTLGRLKRQLEGESEV